MDQMALDGLDTWLVKTQRKTLAEIQCATVDGRRLASSRRLLTFLLVITGAPVLALERSSAPGIRRALMVLACLWLSLALPMLRLLWLEWRNRRRMERLRDGPRASSFGQRVATVGWSSTWSRSR